MNELLTSQAVVRLELAGEELWLLPQRCIWWPARETLIASDLHLGKSGHFRSEGLAVPQAVLTADLERLCDLIESLSVRRLLCLGDLFHSRINPEWPVVLDYRARFKDVEFVLVRGNHDVLPAHRYAELNIAVLDDLTEGPFLFVHDPADAVSTAAAAVTMSGHVHPGVRLRGRGRQTLRLPCFYLGSKTLLLPAFSEFTGLALLRPGKGDRVFVIADGCVVGM